MAALRAPAQTVSARPTAPLARIPDVVDVLPGWRKSNELSDGALLGTRSFTAGTLAATVTVVLRPSDPRRPPAPPTVGSPLDAETQLRAHMTRRGLSFDSLAVALEPFDDKLPEWSGALGHAVLLTGLRYRYAFAEHEGSDAHYIVCVEGLADEADVRSILRRLVARTAALLRDSEGQPNGSW